MEVESQASNKSESVVDKITKALFPSAEVKTIAKKDSKKSSPKVEKKKSADKKKKAAKKSKSSKAPFPVHPEGKVKVIQIIVPRDADNDSSTDEETPKVGKKRKLPVGKVEDSNGNLIKRIGTKREVFHGKAQRTSGGLEAKDIIKSSSGRVVSKAASESARRNWILRDGIKPKAKPALDAAGNVIAPAASAESSSSSSSESEKEEIVVDKE